MIQGPKGHESRGQKSYNPPTTTTTTPASSNPRRSAALSLGITASLGFLVFVGFGLYFISSAAPTYDEPVHLASGYTDLVVGSYHLNAMDHPPFGEMWSALPLLAFRLKTHLQTEDWIQGRIYNYADAFLYDNTVSAGRLLNIARTWVLIVWAALLMAALAEWGWRLWGMPGAAAAALLAAFSPPLISNASLVTTDAPAAVFFFLSFWALSRPAAGRGWWIAAGTFTGLALTSKFSMAVLPAIAALGLLAQARWLREKLAWPNLAYAAVAAAAVLAAVYRFQNLPLYFDGLLETSRRLNQGRSSFFCGQHSITGTPLYFPFALMVKTPIPCLLAATLGFGLWLRRSSPDGLWLAVPPLAYFLPALFSKTQLGYRHILPVYPFLILWAARGASWLWDRGRAARAIALAGAAWLALGVSRVAPFELSYFNEFVGGPSQGYRYLVDSNLDWGQDIKSLAKTLRGLGNPPVLLSYFGVADPSYYGIHYAPLGLLTNVDPARRQGDIPKARDWRYLAVSATNLQAVYYPDKTAFDWLKPLRPVAAPGWSIFLYDLADAPQARAHVRALLGLP